MITVKINKQRLKKFFIEKFQLILLIYVFVVMNIILMYDRYKKLHTSVPNAQDNGQEYIVEFDAREIVLDDIGKVYKTCGHFRLRVFKLDGIKKAVIEPVNPKR